MMKNVTMILALVAVLAMAGTTFAYSINVTKDAVGPAPGLERWVVHFDGINAFQDLSISGVHQTNSVSFGSATSTALLDIIPGAAPAIMTEVDTHILFAIGDLAVAEFGHAETNDASNPAGLDSVGAPWEYGMGSLTTSGGATVTGTAWEQGGFDFMAVVLETGAVPVLLTGLVTSPAMEKFQLSTLTDGGVLVGVPEPSTILMLIAGGLCLLAVRFRK